MKQKQTTPQHTHSTTWPGEMVQWLKHHTTASTRTRAEISRTHEGHKGRCCDSPGIPTPRSQRQRQGICRVSWRASLGRYQARVQQETMPQWVMWSTGKTLSSAARLTHPSTVQSPHLHRKRLNVITHVKPWLTYIHYLCRHLNFI